MCSRSHFPLSQAPSRTFWDSKSGTISVLLLFCLLLLFLIGCRTPHPSVADSQRRTAYLQTKLRELSSTIDGHESDRLAIAAIRGSEALADQYHAVWPPWLHNNLVNLGWRDRGLCFHWANDLMAQLHGMGLWTVQIHLAVAHIDTRREHNALVITGRGQPFSQGLVLDPWRSSGRLWFGPVEGDKYPWKPLPADRVPAELQKFVLTQPSNDP